MLDEQANVLAGAACGRKDPRDGGCCERQTRSCKEWKINGIKTAGKGDGLFRNLVPVDFLIILMADAKKKSKRFFEPLSSLRMAEFGGLDNRLMCFRSFQS